MTVASRSRPRRVRPPHLGTRLELVSGTDTFLGPTRIRLLEAIDRLGSISRAAAEVPLSYKAAWDAVDAMNRQAGQALVNRSAGGAGGGGARLSASGRRLVALYRALDQEYQGALGQLLQAWPAADEDDAEGWHPTLHRPGWRASARNQLRCTVQAVHAADLDDEVLLRLDADQGFAAQITRDSARRLGLAPGCDVQAWIKASAVDVRAAAPRGTPANALRGTVIRVVPGRDRAEVTLALGTQQLTGIQRRKGREARLQPGDAAMARFAASSVMLIVPA
jgi:molybdate transport system regulatory protein